MTRAIDAPLALDGIAWVLALLAGFAGVYYVFATWALHWLATGHYALLACVASSLGLLSLAAILRIPAALIVLFGAAAVVATALSMGVPDALLP